MKFLLPLLALSWFIGSTTQPDDEGQVLFEGFIHLGNDPCPEWTEAALEPEGTELKFSFKAKKNAKERCIVLSHRSIDNRWSLSLNGVELASLTRRGGLETHYYPVPPKVLKNGENQFSLVCDKFGDDITVGEIKLLAVSYRERKGIRPVNIQVFDAANGAPLPARLNIQDPDGNLAEVYYPAQVSVPVRPGIAYTDIKGRAIIELAAGHYEIWASHGMEWSVAHQSFTIGNQETQPIVLRLTHEVDTQGFVAADTHIHTVTGSGHGDATTWERVHSLAAEGVEMAIATDHNHHMDYRPLQKQIGAEAWYTPVIGNEVSTDLGHFNAFPFEANSPIPNHRIQEWPLLIEEIRSKGVKMTILNHPRWPSLTRGPMGNEAQDLNRSTGEFGSGLEKLEVDALEIFNIDCKTVEREEVLLDWFALLNSGQKLGGVGASDSHTVGVPVGQARTYIPGDDSKVGKLKINRLCDTMAEGRMSAAVGIFAWGTLNHTQPGGMHKVKKGRKLVYQLHIGAPSWVTARTVTLFWNGEAIVEYPLADYEGPLDLDLELPLPSPRADGWVVALVRGDTPDGPWWPVTMEHSVAAVNPIYVNADGKGAWVAPFQQ
jgi:hypothetical protein